MQDYCLCRQLRKKEELRSQDTKEKKEEDAIVIRKTNNFFNFIIFYVELSYQI